MSRRKNNCPANGDHFKLSVDRPAQLSKSTCTTCIMRSVPCNQYPEGSTAIPKAQFAIPGFRYAQTRTPAQVCRMPSPAPRGREGQIIP